jgi:hypothetical protein
MFSRFYLEFGGQVEYVSMYVVTASTLHSREVPPSYSLFGEHRIRGLREKTLYLRWPTKVTILFLFFLFYLCMYVEVPFLLFLDIRIKIYGEMKIMGEVWAWRASIGIN